MSKSPTRQSPLPPTFSTLHAKQDAVLVCTKKDGVIENFDYVPLENVRYKGVPLKAVFDSNAERIAWLETENQKMFDRITELSDKITNFVKIFAGGTPQ